jgi:tetratricopeptide (TPR) repeat protein
MLAKVYGNLGKRDASADAWSRVAMLDPTDADASYEVGTILARKGDWSGVRSKMLAAEAAGAADSRHFLLIGEADTELRYWTEAETYLKRAGDLERGRYLLGALYYDRGKPTKARAEFEKVIEMNPDNNSAHLHLGWIHYNDGDLKRALHHYREAIRVEPKEPLAQLSLAALLAEMKRPGEAITHYRTALSLDGIPRSERKKAYNSLSRLLVEGNMLRDAVAVIEEGLAEFASSGGLYYQWGEALLKSGKPHEAREKYKAAAQDPIWREIALRKLHSIE